MTTEEAREAGRVSELSCAVTKPLGSPGGAWPGAALSKVTTFLTCKYSECRVWSMDTALWLGLIRLFLVKHPSSLPPSSPALNMKSSVIRQ